MSNPLIQSLVGALFAALCLALLFRSWVIAIGKNPETVKSFLGGYFRSAPLEKRAEIMHFLVAKYCPCCGNSIDRCPGPILHEAPCQKWPS